MAIRSLLHKPWLGYLLAGIFLLLSMYLFFNDRVPGDKRAGADLASAVVPTESEGVVRFTSSVNLATRMGSDPSSLPLFRAGATQGIKRDVEFKAPRTGTYRLVMQMTDTPFAIYKQEVGEFLEVVKDGEAVGQTFTVDSDIPQLGGVQVKLEARSILRGQPADTAPDAPLTATLYRAGSQEKLAEYVLPVEQAGLNDAWRWVSFPLNVDLGRGDGRKFFVEFTSPATVNGWALSRVSNGFESIADHYAAGELLINGKPREDVAGGDLTFAVLTRSTATKQARLLVDETELTLAPLAETPGWFRSQPVELDEGAHLLIVQSDNPHLSFFRFIFVPDVAQEQNSTEQSETTATPTPSPENSV